MHHVIVTYDTVNTRFYLDGIERNPICIGTAVSLPTTDSPVTFGGGLTGRLDEIALYDSALPPPRVRAHNSAGR